MDLATPYYMLRLLAKKPRQSQRQLARELRVSVGKAHYVLKRLMHHDWVKAGQRGNQPQNANVDYQLTCAGEKALERLAQRFLARRVAEYRQIKSEIEQLRNEMGETPGGGPSRPAGKPDQGK